MSTWIFLSRTFSSLIQLCQSALMFVVFLLSNGESIIAQIVMQLYLVVQDLLSKGCLYECRNSVRKVQHEVVLIFWGGNQWDMEYAWCMVQDNATVNISDKQREIIVDGGIVRKQHNYLTTMWQVKTNEEMTC